MTAAADFPSTPASIAAARRFVARQLAAMHGMAKDDLDEVTLMVSELATNSVRHAGTAYRVAVYQIGNCVRIEVSDTGGGQARLRTPGPRDPHGRGLQIVSALADAWGVDDGSGSPGKTTWFTYRVKVPRSDTADRRPF